MLGLKYENSQTMKSLRACLNSHSHRHAHTPEGYMEMAEKAVLKQILNDRKNNKKRQMSD